MTFRVVYVDSSPVGTGKTQRAIERAVNTPARWLFAVQRIDGIKELERRIRGLHSTNGNLALRTIMSSKEIRGGSVRQEVESLPTKYEQGHVIVICSHAALMMSDLSQFAGWNLVIDEVPEVLQMADLGTNLDVAFFAQNYFLTQLTDKWSVVSPTDLGAKIKGSVLRQDDSHRHLGVFHQRVMGSANGRQHVVCNLQSWAEMGNEDVRWVWWSLFTLEQLRAFDRVLFLGNGFFESTSAKILCQWSTDVEWQEVGQLDARILTERPVSIIYFCNQRRASKNYFESDQRRA